MAFHIEYGALSMLRKFNRLYIHVPFCASKCGYCAFYSIPRPDEELADAWLDKILRDFEASAEKCVVLNSVFIGGGTPTLLSPTHLRRLFEGILAHFAISPESEVSIECNPETLTSEKANVVADFANRVSLGVQSFDEQALRTLGRRGTPEDFARAAAALAERGIENLGCDLIHSVPGETLDVWRSDLNKAVKSGMRHVSCYSLTIEEGSRLHAKATPLEQMASSEANELDAEMWETAGEILADAGLDRYEVSNHAVPGFECRHNMEIWHGDAYLGCGPAAASFDGATRWSNPTDISEWLAGAPPERDEIPAEARAAEILAIGLRTARGWKAAEFAVRTGFDFDFRKTELTELAEAGLLTIGENTVAPTRKGLALWDSIAETLM